MKTVIQSEPAECGLACLAMVAASHGLHLSMPEMRRRFSLSLKGAKLSSLIYIGQRLGFRARAVRVELEELVKVGKPSILHWDLNHFVVLSSVKRGHLVILDPARGSIRLTMAEASAHFTGIVLELEPTNGFVQKPPVPSVSIRSLMGPVRGLWKAVGQIAALSLSLQIFVIIGPFYMQWVVDQALVSADRGLLTVLSLGFGLAAVLQVGIGWLRGYAIVHLSSVLSLQWATDVFAHLLKLPLDFFEKRHLGDITSRVGSVHVILSTLTTSFVEVFIDGLMAVVTLALMVVYSAKLAGVTLFAVGLYLATRYMAYWKVSRRTEHQLIASAAQQTHLLESLRGMQSLKVAGQESFRRVAYENLTTDTVNLENWISRAGLAFSSANQLIFGVERVAVVWIGATMAMNNIFSIGMLIAYLAYKEQFAQRTGALIDKAFDFRMLRLHAERLADIVLTEPDADPSFDQDIPAPQDLRIEVENLSYRYADGEPWILENCSFTVAAGESVAIVGASGCGKTTLIKLLLGVLRPTSGSIFIGGQDINKVGSRNLRPLVGSVMQEDQLFAGTIAQNIAFFDPDFDLDRVEQAAKLASVHEEIVAMPMAYQSLIGDMGSSMSGGQKQRVILARALYRSPRLLFLDEATSHLDVDRERQVNAAIRSVRLTRIIVAHRPETIASADRILRMTDGKFFVSNADAEGLVA